MIPEELIKLVDDVVARKSKSQHIELKKAYSGTPTGLYDTLSSFANQYNGGIIIFGIDEKNNYEVCGVYDPQDLQIKVNEQSLQMKPTIRPVFTIVNYHGKYVVSAEISECDLNDKPCFYKGSGRIRGSYVRVGESDIPMNEYEVYSYEAYKKKIRDELRIIERSNLNDFNQNLLDEYFVKVKKEKPLLANRDKNKILALQGLVIDDKPTLAGLMILGDYPQKYFPQLSVTAMLVDGNKFGDLGSNEERFIDNKRIDGTIPEILEEALLFVIKNMKHPTIIDKNGNRIDTYEYPIRAIREVILNALIHRDYSVHTEDSPIRIIMYKDRIEVENPGGLYGRLTISDLGNVPGDTRNPYIASNLEIMIDTENRFSGIPTIINEMENAGLKPPLFENNRGTFKVTLYNSRIIENNELNLISDIKKKIIDYCKEPKTREEIAKMLEIDSQYYVMSKYVKPLIKEGKLKQTILDKPKSKYQKYQSI